MFLFLTKLIGLWVAGLGIALLIEPGLFPRIVDACLKEKRVHTAGILKIVSGLIFVIAAQGTALPEFIGILGLLQLIGGVFTVLFGTNKAYPVIKWWEERPILIKRSLAFLYFFIGAVIVFNIA
jgi:hypothetical protein